MKKETIKKIGTLSLNINTLDFNYGAILHSWAFQQYLNRQNNIKVEIIDYITPTLEYFNFKRPITSSIKAKQWKLALKHLLFYIPYKKRQKKFREFIKTNMIISSKHYTQRKLNNEKIKYDILICESDVIWYPGQFRGQFDKTFFLSLDSMKNTKKIAYSPSMTSLRYVEEKKDELTNLLKNLDYISCRESYEVEVLERLSNKKVEHVMDPVFLLNDKDYDIITGERIIKEDYLLLYLPVNDNKKLRKDAIKYAKKNNLKILEITTKLRPIFGHKTLTSAGVEEFLSSIKYAKVVFTNSFHAICFAVLFEREFYVFTRKYNGKTKDICKSLDLLDRFMEDDIFVERKKINYIKVNKIVNSLREKSAKWLLDAIND